MLLEGKEHTLLVFWGQGLLSIIIDDEWEGQQMAKHVCNW